MLWESDCPVWSSEWLWRWGLMVNCSVSTPLLYLCCQWDWVLQQGYRRMWLVHRLRPLITAAVLSFVILFVLPCCSWFANACPAAFAAVLRRLLHQMVWAGLVPADYGPVDGFRFIECSVHILIFVFLLLHVVLSLVNYYFFSSSLYGELCCFWVVTLFLFWVICILHLIIALD